MPHVLRLCSVFEPASCPDGPGAARFDPIGGMQNHTACLTRCLDRLGVEQTVLTSRLGARPGRVAVGRSAMVVRLGLPIARLRQLWGACAVRHVLAPGHAVDVVHAHQGEDIATLLLGRLAAWRHRAPLVVTVHLSVRHTLQGRSVRAAVLRRFGGWLEAQALRRADAVLVLAERTAALLRSDGIEPDRLRVLPSGFEPDLFERPGPDPYPAAGRPRVAYVGRLAPQKQPQLVVQAFGRLRTSAYLLVVGDGPDRALVETAVADLPNPGLATATGFVEHSAIPAVLASIDVLVLPSAYEELGSVLVEAMAAGVPVVATAVGGIPEVVSDGETGLLVPPGDTVALGEAIDRVLTEPGLAERLRAGARRQARRYAWPTLAEDVAALYESLGARSDAPLGAPR